MLTGPPPKFHGTRDILPSIRRLTSMKRQRPCDPVRIRWAQARPTPSALPDARLEIAAREQAAKVLEGLLGRHRQSAPARRRVDVRCGGVDGRRVPACESD